MSLGDVGLAVAVGVELDLVAMVLFERGTAGPHAAGVVRQVLERGDFNLVRVRQGAHARRRSSPGP